MTRHLTRYLAIGLLAFSTTAWPATVVFDVDPSVATPNVPIEFNIATDVLSFDPTIFGLNQILFASGLDSELPTTGVNTVVIQNTGTPFLAGIAQDLIANRIEDSGPGFFVYFNTNLQQPRLVFVNDLGDPDSAFTVLARFPNLAFSDMPSFQASNFAAIPEPSSFVLMSAGAALALARTLRRRRMRSL